jgi:hypothetical protein
MVWMISASIAYRSGDYDVHLVRIGHASFPVRASQCSVEHSMTSSLARLKFNSFEPESSAGPNYLREWNLHGSDGTDRTGAGFLRRLADEQQPE